MLRVHRNEDLLSLMEEGFPEAENHYNGLVVRQGKEYQRW